MPYAIIHHHPGGTRERYEASLKAVHPADGSLPNGQIFHAAGPSAEGWVIMAIFDTKKTWGTYLDEVLEPQCSAGIQGAFTTDPHEIHFEVETLRP